MDPYDYICEKEKASYMSDIKGQLSEKKMKQYISSIGVDRHNVEYWNNLAKYFLDKASSRDSFGNIEEIRYWCIN